jgi:hypothetical protein
MIQLLVNARAEIGDSADGQYEKVKRLALKNGFSAARKLIVSLAPPAFQEVPSEEEHMAMENFFSYFQNSPLPL